MDTRRISRAFSLSPRTVYGTSTAHRGSAGFIRNWFSLSIHRDRVENQEAVDMVAEVVAAADEESTGLQEAAESLTLEAYVRGSRDNIGTLVIALD